MTPRVGIVMGSDSDLPVMERAAELLTELGVPYELGIVSAHRTPKRLVEYAETAEARGLQVIVAGAGGAAHLPGMLAAITPLPVIGVPIAATRHPRRADRCHGRSAGARERPRLQTGPRAACARQGRRGRSLRLRPWRACS